MVDRMLAGRQQEVEAKFEERARIVNDRMAVACAFDTIPGEFRKHWLAGSVQEACHEGQLRGPFQCCSTLLRNKLIFDHTAGSIPSRESHAWLVSRTNGRMRTDRTLPRT